VTVRIVRLGSPRLPGEGVRIGTVRRPPRGVRREDWSAQDWFDVWYPELAPAAATIALARADADPRAWQAFAKAYRREMAAPAASRTLDVLAALSHGADFSVGCYCADEAHCHRSLLRVLLSERGVRIA